MYVESESFKHLFELKFPLVKNIGKEKSQFALIFAKNTGSFSLTFLVQNLHKKVSKFRPFL